MQYLFSHQTFNIDAAKMCCIMHTELLAIFKFCNEIQIPKLPFLSNKLFEIH